MVHGIISVGKTSPQIISRNSHICNRIHTYVVKSFMKKTQFVYGADGGVFRKSLPV